MTAVRFVHLGFIREVKWRLGPGTRPRQPKTKPITSGTWLLRESAAFFGRMQWVKDIYAARRQGRPVVSFEVFPPKTDEGMRNLLGKTIPALLQAKPDFCSVTYGAGGSTRDKTLELVDRIQTDHHLTAVAHLTCVNATRAEIADLLGAIRKLGVRNVLALRGDPPGGGEFVPAAGGFEFASQLVEFIRDQKEFSVGVAGFPEGHIACKAGKLADWEFLKRKVDAGADYILTQLFFDNRDFLDFRDHLVQKLGVTVPIVPGIVSILSAMQISRFTALCGARIPDELAARLQELANDDNSAAEFGIEYATRQCAELLREGVPGIHFYALNKSAAMLRVTANLGLT